MSPDPFSLVTPDERSEIRGPSRPWQHGPRLARLRRLAGVTTEDVLHWVSSVRVAPLVDPCPLRDPLAEKGALFGGHFGLVGQRHRLGDDSARVDLLDLPLDLLRRVELCAVWGILVYIIRMVRRMTGRPPAGKDRVHLGR